MGTVFQRNWPLINLWTILLKMFFYFMWKVGQSTPFFLGKQSGIITEPYYDIFLLKIMKYAWQLYFFNFNFFFTFSTESIICRNSYLLFSLNHWGVQVFKADFCLINTLAIISLLFLSSFEKSETIIFNLILKLYYKQWLGALHI